MKKKFEALSFFEMANISKRGTGLPYDIWISREEIGHSPRIKVEFEAGVLTPVLVSENPKIPKSVKKVPKFSSKNFKKVQKWILANEDILLKLWNKEYDDREAILALDRRKIQLRKLKAMQKKKL